MEHNYGAHRTDKGQKSMLTAGGNVSSKTGKALVEILGKTPDVMEFEKAYKSYKSNQNSHYCKKRFENYLAIIQTKVLKALSESKKMIRNWDKDFVLRNSRLPNLEDYNNSNQMKQTFHRDKIAMKLLQSWKITVHLN